MNLVYHPEAERELVESAQFYEGRVESLGVQFLDDADQAVSMILRAPQSWKVIDRDVRSYFMPRFPYSIYYRVHSDHIHILAFKHFSRHPDYWRHRISD